MKTKAPCGGEICRYPFETAEIYEGGVVSFCCFEWIKQNSIGNIYTAPFEQMWNSPKAVEIRKSVLAGDYKFCNLGICHRALQRYPPASIDPENVPLPRKVTFGHDAECNLSCVTCRKSLRYNSDEEFEKLNSDMESIYLPMLSNAEEVSMSLAGDPFASRHCRVLIRRIADVYPKIKFTFITNGVLASPDMLDSLGLLGRLNWIEISIHSASMETWMKFTRGSKSQYAALLDNIKSLVKLRDAGGGKLNGLGLGFVLTSFNYTELADFVKLAKNLPVDIADIWGYRNWVQTAEEAADMSVFLPEHGEYGKLKEILLDPVFEWSGVCLHPEIQKVRKEALRDKAARNNSPPG